MLRFKDWWMLRMTSEDASFLPRSISDRWDRDRFASSATSWRVLDCAIRVWRSACPMSVRSKSGVGSVDKETSVSGILLSYGRRVNRA